MTLDENAKTFVVYMAFIMQKNQYIQLEKLKFLYYKLIKFPLRYLLNIWVMLMSFYLI